MVQELSNWLKKEHMPVIIIRHGEKPLPPLPEGHNLSVRGRIRAAALAMKIVDTYGKPDVLLATNSPKHNRTQETLLPLSKLIDVKIKKNFGAEEPEKQVDQILKKWPNKLVLVCWEHHMISRMTKALLGVTENIPEWNDNIFDQFWVVNMTSWSLNKSTLIIAPQQLLFGDLESYD